MSTFVLYNGVPAGQRRTRVRASAFLETKSALEITDGELVIACVILDEDERIRLLGELTAIGGQRGAQGAETRRHGEGHKARHRAEETA